MIRKNHEALRSPLSGVHHTRDAVTGVEYLCFEKLLMGDWDMPHAAHPEGCATVPNPEYALGILRRDVWERPDHVWRVYRTPAGVRAFLTSSLQVYQTRYAGRLMQDLWVDPYYRQATHKQGEWWCRVSPKPGRQGDFTAAYWQTVRGSRGKELPAAREMLQVHDELCRRVLPFRHVVRVTCHLCPENEYGRKLRACGYCGGKGHRYVYLPQSEIQFFRAIEADRQDDAPRLIFSDRLTELGEDDAAVEMVRAAVSWSLHEVTVRTPRPRPVTGPFRDWDLDPPSNRLPF
jgi:uncharacterized protein (TIGR02996 family)